LSDARTFKTAQRVRLGDVTPKGRVRLDAIARYLQDVANDDGVDGLGVDAAAWVVRRTTIDITRFPVLREELTLRTWASGVGSRWAERTTSIEGADGGRLLATALWVHVDLDTGRPKKLPPEFETVYAASTGGRVVSARLTHDDAPAGAPEVPWVLRFADFDVLGHVNNAVYWAIVEEHLDVAAPTRVEIEYRGGLDRGQAVRVLTDMEGLWILGDGTVAASARRSPMPL
jgi:acyl-ACP thioesterase